MTNDLAMEVGRLTDACRAIFGPEDVWISADGYPKGLALCIIDSVFSTGSHYQSVINVVAAYCRHRKNQGGNPYTGGVGELLASFEEVGDSRGWAELVDNHKPAHTRTGALLKAEVVYRAARALKREGILSVADLHELHTQDEHLTPVKKLWLSLPSQSSGVTYNYLLILAGFQSVKPDRMIVRFVAEHAGLDGRKLTVMETAKLVAQAAELYPTQPRKLDHVIWRHVSGRQIFKADELVNVDT